MNDPIQVDAQRLEAARLERRALIRRLEQDGSDPQTLADAREVERLDEAAERFRAATEILREASEAAAPETAEPTTGAACTDPPDPVLPCRS